MNDIEKSNRKNWKQEIKVNEKRIERRKVLTIMTNQKNYYWMANLEF